VWCCHSIRAGTFASVACSHLELVFTRLRGAITATLRGPETRASEVYCPAEGEWFAIRFSAGAFMPETPIARLLNGNDVTLPAGAKHFVWLDGSRWEYPDFENAETFVSRLHNAGLLSRDRAVAAVLQGEREALCERSTQRHFLQAMGMTYSAMRQIERARHAAMLLRRGVSIADTVHEAGFFDQSHLTRSLRRLIGLTPAKIAHGKRQMSFLYNTSAAR
jgi:hypothetical protein